MEYNFILIYMLFIYALVTVSHGLADKKDAEVNAIPGKGQKKNQCCQNGGICVMGTFCKCKKNYFGRRCQHKVEFKPCGNVPHGSWIRSDCNLCKCFDGSMSCIPRIYDGCDYDSPLLDTKATTKDPLEASLIKILSNDRDFMDKKQLDEYNIEDYYYMDDENSSTCTTAAPLLMKLCLIVVWLVII